MNENEFNDWLAAFEPEELDSDWEAYERYKHELAEEERWYYEDFTE